MDEANEEQARILAMIEQGGEEVLTEEEADSIFVEPKLEGHDANLAEGMDKSDLDRIATEVIQDYDTDLESREDWFEREAAGIRMLGVSDRVEGGAKFDGASDVVHPLLAEACVQFQARAIAELWPSGGPVKTKVIGKVTPEREQQAERVKDYMNYLYTRRMPDAFDEEDNLLFRLPISGSCFKKIAYDPIEGMVCSRFVEPSDFVVPYSATSLRTTDRFTHVLRLGKHAVDQYVELGWYRDAKIGQPNDLMDRPVTHEEIDRSEGRESTDYSRDSLYTVLEQYKYLDPKLVGDEGEIDLPYIITVDKDSQEVLSIRRNWSEEDKRKRKRIYFVHKKFLPGLGFYGYGFLHIIGSLARAATGTVRALLDAAAFSNMQGGFKDRNLKIDGGDMPVAPGEWKDVEHSAEELSRGLFPLNYKEPSKTLYELLGYLDQVGQRFASTTEIMVGDANNNGPVGTTLALIEQGTKVFSAIHKRLHNANAEEYRILAELNRDYLPDRYPYDVEGGSRFVLKTDFDERVDVIPVSDPNVISNTQRIAKAQAVMELAAGAPNIYDMEAAHRNMLEALRVEDVDKFIPSKQATHMGPIEEDMAILMNKPVSAFPDQDHQAHMTVHEHWFMTLPQDMQKLYQGQYYAHQAEHLAWQHKAMYEQMLGIPLPDPQFAGGQPVDPMSENAYAMFASRVTQLMPKPQNQSQLIDDAENQRKDMLAQADIRREDQKASADIAREAALNEARITGEYSKYLNQNMQ